MPRSARAQRRRVVHAVADDRDPPTLGLRATPRPRPCPAGSTSATTRSMPTASATARAVSVAVAGDHHRLHPEVVQRGDRGARPPGLGVSATRYTASTAPSRPANTGRLAAARAAPSRPRRSRAGTAPTNDGAPDPHGLAGDDGLDAEAGLVGEGASAPTTSAPGRAQPGDDGARDRVLGRVLGRRDRTARAPRRRRRARVSVPTSVMRPVVTVPVLSSTATSTRRVASSTSPPLITMPSWAPRPGARP